VILKIGAVVKYLAWESNLCIDDYPFSPRSMKVEVSSRERQIGVQSKLAMMIGDLARVVGVGGRRLTRIHVLVSFITGFMS
jgi:hypothetical protein